MAVLFFLLTVPLTGCEHEASVKPCGAVSSADVQLSIKGKNGEIARLRTGQTIGFSDAPDWTFRASETRVLQNDSCGGRTVFKAVQPGSSFLDAEWAPGCLLSHPACAVPSREFRVTVIVDPAGPPLPVLGPNLSAVETIGLLAVGQTVEVAMPRDFQFAQWEHVRISNADVVRRVDSSTPAGIGIVYLEALRPGISDLTADAKPATNSSSAGFFRIEFIIRTANHLADVESSDKDSGQTVSLGVRQVLVFSVPTAQSELFQGAEMNQPLLIPLVTPTLNGENGTRYLMAEAAGTEKLWWASCPSTQAITSLCQPEVTVNVVPSGLVGVVATDSDREKQFRLQVGQEIVFELHPYIAPWNGVWPSAPPVLDRVDEQTIGGVEVWTFKAVRIGHGSLVATYSCPAKEACPIDPRIVYEVTAG